MRDVHYPKEISSYLQEKTLHTTCMSNDSLDMTVFHWHEWKKDNYRRTTKEQQWNLGRTNERRLLPKIDGRRFGTDDGLLMYSWNADLREIMECCRKRKEHFQPTSYFFLPHLPQQETIHSAVSIAVLTTTSGEVIGNPTPVNFSSSAFVMLL